MSKAAAAPRTRAIVRPPGRTYPQALTRLDPAPPVNLATARVQHASYVVALQAAGLEVVALAADDDHPDAVFVQDRVAIVGGRAIVGPSAVAERRGEAEAIVAALPKGLPVATLRAPACLDWGDVLMTEKALFVGLSERSNEAAVRQLREMLAPDWMVEGVPAAARPAASALRAAPTWEGESCWRSRRWPTSAGRAG